MFMNTLTHFYQMTLVVKNQNLLSQKRIMTYFYESFKYAYTFILKIENKISIFSLILTSLSTVRLAKHACIMF